MSQLNPEIPETFESQMAEAVELHNNGQYQDALFVRDAIYSSLDPSAVMERGRVARDIAASYDRLGDNSKAEQWANRAFSLHNSLINDAKSPKLDTHAPNLSIQQRLKAKAKALAGGVAAIGINMLTTYSPGRRRSLAVKIANEVL